MTTRLPSLLLSLALLVLPLSTVFGQPGDGQVVNVVDFGAVSGGAASANVAAFQAAHNALPASGGIIIVPVGDFSLDSQITTTKPVIWQGQGHGSRVIATNATMTVFHVSTTKRVTFRDFFIDSTAAKTNGAGIQATGDGTIGLCGSLSGGPGVYGMTVQNMLIRNQYYGIVLEDACIAQIVNNSVTEFYGYGLKITTINNPSASSNFVNGNVFASQRSGSKAAIVNSGIDAVNNTFFSTGSPVLEFATISAGNDVARLVGNHIEGTIGAAAVALKVNPTGVLSRLVISGNTIDADTTAILLTRASSSSVDGAVITGNHLWVNVGGSGSACLDATYADNLTVTGNMCGSVQGATTSNMTGFYLRDGVNNARIDANNFRFSTNNGTTCVIVGTSSVNVALGDQNCVGPGTIFAGGSPSTRLDGFWPFTFANLPAIGVGSRVYCTDCDPPSNPCQSTFPRTGAFAVRTNPGAPTWACGY